MLSRSWQDSLRQTLVSLPAANGRPRVSIVGIGHTLRGDDAAGVVLAQRLSLRLKDPKVQIIDGGPAPVNCCGLLLRWQPDLILFVDAAAMDSTPGSMRLLQWQDVLAAGGETHHFSLRILADYLAQEAACPVLLLGIQPAASGFCTTLSPAVEAAVSRAAVELSAILSFEEVTAV